MLCLSKITSKMAHIQYMPMPINNGSDNILYLAADLKSSCKIDIKPLVIPHPKHSIPKIYFTGHNDVENIFVKSL